MSLDIDECCEGNRKAMQELSDMRERIEELEIVIASVAKWAESVPVEYGSSLIEAAIKKALSS